jgi:hypothetical protein
MLHNAHATEFRRLPIVLCTAPRYSQYPRVPKELSRTDTGQRAKNDRLLVQQNAA